MTQIVLIGIAAGAASALLFASIVSGSALAVPLFYLSPLPILIAGLGWSQRAGLIAAFFASAALGGILGGFFFISFLTGIGLPAWFLGYLALLARPVPDGNGGTAVEWYPAGHIVVWAAILAAGVVTLGIFTVATDAESLRSILRQAFEPLFQREGEAAQIPEAGFVRTLIDYPDRILPPAAGVLTTIVTVFALWLAGRTVRISGRLKRPWPDITAITFQPFALPVLIAALVGSFILSGLTVIIATVLAAALLTAFAMLGLAVLHAITRPLGGRGLILGAVYMAIVIFGWPMLLMAMLGLAEPGLGLRERAARRSPPPAPPALPPD